MRSRWQVVLVVWLLLPGQVWTADEPAAPIPLVKEPKYRSTPRYCRLIFGPKAQEQFYLVLDGSDLYLDLNANGDLTDAGESLVPRGRSLNQTIDSLWNGTKHDLVFDTRLRNGTGENSGQRCILTVPPKGAFVTVEWHGKQTYLSTGRFATDPNKAPTIRFDGPLQMRLIYLKPLELTVAAPPMFYQDDRLMVLSVGVETPGKGPTAPGALLLHELRDRNEARSVLAADLHPIAEIEFPHLDAAKAPIKISLDMKDRFSGYQFIGKLRVPREAASGKARVTLSFPGWKDGSVRDLVVEVPVVAAEQ